MPRTTQRRVVSLWFPRLAAERLTRLLGAPEAAFAAVAEAGGALRLAALSAEAEQAGLRRGMALVDARAILPELRTRPADPPAEAAFLAALARWALRYTPWVATDGADGLTLDVSGCAHLFGGEAAMLEDMRDRLGRAGLTAIPACADTRGAAWALARFGGGRTGCAAPAPRPAAPGAEAPPLIAAPGATRAALAALPVAALRIAPEAAEGLARLGLRRIGDLASPPRATLARRFGPEVVRRLDQALGAAPEPVGVARPAPVFAARLSLPEPIGRVDDVAAALERLLARLTDRLAEHGAGARRLALSLRRVDRSDLQVEIGLARPSRDRAVMAELFARPLAELDAGFGIEALRLEAIAVEPMAARQHRGPLDAAQARETRGADGGGGAAEGPPSCAEGPPSCAEGDAFALLLSRLGGRLGFERVRRFLPADSHIPTRAVIAASAAHAEPAPFWPADRPLRPITLFAPEPIAPDPPDAGPGRPLRGFRWRGRVHRVACAAGPERIAPEWWLDDPDWRDGPRDYWRVETETGARLWLHHRPASDRLATWFAEGEFA